MWQRIAGHTFSTKPIHFLPFFRDGEGVMRKYLLRLYSRPVTSDVAYRVFTCQVVDLGDLEVLSKSVTNFFLCLLYYVLICEFFCLVICCIYVLSIWLLLKLCGLMYRRIHPNCKHKHLSPILDRLRMRKCLMVGDIYGTRGHVSHLTGPKHQWWGMVLSFQFSSAPIRWIFVKCRVFFHNLLETLTLQSREVSSRCEIFFITSVRVHHPISDDI